MKWDEASKIIKQAWNEKIETSNGSYYKPLIKKILKKKKLFINSAKRFGTPQYILDEEELKQHC